MRYIKIENLKSIEIREDGVHILLNNNAKALIKKGELIKILNSDKT